MTQVSQVQAWLAPVAAMDGLVVHDRALHNVTA
jgi:hypothetical protein